MVSAHAGLSLLFSGEADGRLHGFAFRTEKHRTNRGKRWRLPRVNECPFSGYRAYR